MYVTDPKGKVQVFHFANGNDAEKFYKGYGSAGGTQFYQAKIQGTTYTFSNPNDPAIKALMPKEEIVKEGATEWTLSPDSARAFLDILNENAYLSARMADQYLQIHPNPTGPSKRKKRK